MSQFLTPTFIISVLIALSVHEWAHGFVAYRLGDATAKREGRLTLNPIAHLDPIGTVLFLLVGFGWGKPVPVDPRYFRNIKRDCGLVAVAGPLSNLLLALFAFLVLLLTERYAIGGAEMMVRGGDAIFARFTVALMTDFLQINLVLMAFNLLPVAPLDGSKILHPFIPLRHEERYEDFMRQGPKILLFLVILGPLFRLPVLSLWIGWIVDPVLRFFSIIAALL